MSTEKQPEEAKGQTLGFIGTVISRWISRPKERVILLGDDPRMRLLAAELGAAHKPVSLMKPTIDEGDKPAPGVSLTSAGAPWDAALTRAGAEAATCLIASTADNELNQSICKIARDEFQVPTTIMRLCLLPGVTSWAKFTDTGMARMQWSEVVRAAIGEISPSPLLARLMRLTDRDQIVDLKLHSPAFAGRAIVEVPLDDCEVVALTRRGASLGVLDQVDLELADILTLVGPTYALNRVRESFLSL